MLSYSRIRKHKKDDLELLTKTSKIPVSIQPLQIPLYRGFDENKNMDVIGLDVGGGRSNFMDKIKTFSKTIADTRKYGFTLPFNDTWSFYYVQDHRPYVLGVKWINTTSIHKIRFSINGVLLDSFTDNIKGGYVHRVTGTHTTVYNDNNLALYTEKNLKLVSIKNWKKPKISFVTKPNIGVLDTETYFGSDNVSRIYAIGFKTDLDKQATTYYLDAKTKSSEEIVIAALHEMMRAKYGSIKYYCHNFGGYDAFYIIPVIYNYNDKHPENPFILNYVFRDQRIIKLTISKRFEVEEKDKVKTENEDKLENVNTTLRKIDIMDSYCIFPISQYDLCKVFETKLVKGVFPHGFADD